MATAPTSENAARHILKVFLENNCRSGDVLLIGSFITKFDNPPWQTSDLKTGLEYAAQQQWVEVSSDGLKLTEQGFSAA